MKGLVYCLSHDCHRTLQVVIRRQCDLLCRTVSTTVVVSDWCITNLAHGWEGFDPKLSWYCQRT